MNILAAENKFKKGLLAFIDGRHDVAANTFKAAIDIETHRKVQRRQMRYLSYYALSRALSSGLSHELVRMCEHAAKIEFYNPDLQLNLGRIYTLGGKTTRALAAFERGLRLAPSHPALNRALKQLDRRNPPTISAMSRTHPLNIFLGRLRSRIRPAPVKSMQVNRLSSS